VAGRKYIGPTFADELVFRFVEIMKDVNSDEFKKSITKHVSSSSDAAIAIAAYDRLMSVA